MWWFQYDGLIGLWLKEQLCFVGHSTAIATMGFHSNSGKHGLSSLSYRVLKGFTKTDSVIYVTHSVISGNFVQSEDFTIFQDTRQGVHGLCSVNYAPWQWDLGPKRLRSTTASQKWPCHDQVYLRCKAGRWDFLGCASPETGYRRDHGCSSHSAS